MAFFNVRTLLSLILMLLIVMSLNGAVESISTREYESMHGVLRGHGYNLVCNAMATSDLQWELLTFPTNASFTIFAPTDASLFALDMIQTASSYTDTLRFHIVPLRLSLSNLRSLASGSVLPTLLPSSALRLTTRPALSVSGVDIALPGLFYSHHVAVHGLGGILSLTSIVPYASPKLPSPPLTTLQSPKVNTSTADFNTTTADFNTTTADFNTTSTDFNTTTADLSPAAALSPEVEWAAVTNGTPPSPSPSATQEYEISPAFVSEEEDEISLASSPATAPSPVVVEASPWTDALRKRARARARAQARARVRASLREITTEADDEKLNSESDDDISGESVSFSDVDVEKCGASDAMAIDCFVPEGEDGLDHVSIHHVVRVMA